MQIGFNSTGMPAELTVVVDKSGHSYCVVVVKGTFDVHSDGEVSLAEEQQPLIFADVHSGDPSETSIEYECDFAPYKTRCDVLLNGNAYSPKGRPTTNVLVGLKVGSMAKTFNVIGDRVWDAFAHNVSASRPQSFTKMPISYDLAFGGIDNFHPDQVNHSAFMANPVGRGYHKKLVAEFVDGKPIPNMEERNRPVTSPQETYNPMSFGSLGRGWASRVKYAGTYDARWLNETFPFLPSDFDERYFQSAPVDQQVEYLKGGETVQCSNLTPSGSFNFTIPQLRIPVDYRFRDRDESSEPNLDTLIVEPDKERFMLVWRTRAVLGRKLNALREVRVGESPQVHCRCLPAGNSQLKSIADSNARERRPETDMSLQ